MASIFNPKIQPKSNIGHFVVRVLLGSFLFFAGISHLTFNRIEFLAQVPAWIPIDPDLVVILSGIVEILLGASLLFLSSKKVQIGWLTALFFVLIFPGNISQYVNGIDAFGLDTDRDRFIRLFLQPVLIFMALWSTGAWQLWIKRNK